MLLSLLSSLTRSLANTFTLIIIVVCGALWAVGLHSDALFLLSTVTLNTTISVVQEVRARAKLRALELLSAPTATIMRAGHKHDVPATELCVGDHVALKRGDQIPADGLLLKADGLFVNESLLTGEADEVQLYSHHPVSAGSFVVSGSGLFRVTATGSATKAGGMTAKLKWYQAKLTPLQRTIGRIIRALSYTAIILGILIYLDGARNGTEIANTLSTIASGAVSIVPEGLLLATTLLFAYGALKIGREQVLIQRIGAIEGFSRLKILCLDKTGTITENRLALESIERQKPYTDDQLRIYLGALLSTGESASPTTDALIEYKPGKAARIFDFIPFSSSRKFSAVLLAEDGLHRALALGAPEVLDRHCELSDHHCDVIRNQSQQGNRVLLLVDYGLTRTALSAGIEKEGKPVAMIVLKHTLRPDALDTIFYLQAHNVKLKVISGDSKDTVQAVAHQAGIREWKKALTGDELAELSPKEWERRIPATTIFARVLPEQKERIIATLQKHAFTGMIGDGVNDALALKKADLSISFSEGSQAARQVSDVVLLDNRFSAIPTGIRLGAQIILGVQMVACLFFNKITVGSTVLGLSYLLDLPYPLSTRYLLLLNIFTIGLPTLLWSLAPAKAQGRIDDDKWLIPVLRFSLVNGMITGFAIISAYATARLLPQTDYAPETVSLYVALVLGIGTVWLIPRFLGAVRDKNVSWYPAAYTAVALLLIFFGGQGEFVEELFQITQLDLPRFLLTLSACAAGGAAMIVLSERHKSYVVADN